MVNKQGERKYKVVFIMMLIIFVLIGFYVIYAFWYNYPIILQNSLLIQTIYWKEIGSIEGLSDFDADGNDELLVRDKAGNWWCVPWEKRCSLRKLIPIPADFELWEGWVPYEGGRIVGAKSCQVAVWGSKHKAILVTLDSKKNWVLKTVEGVTGRQSVVVTDLDGDEHTNDVLILANGHQLIWFQRGSNGYIRLRDNLNLSRRFEKVAVLIANNWRTFLLLSPSYFEVCLIRNNRLQRFKTNNGQVYWTKKDINRDTKLDLIEVWVDHNQKELMITLSKSKQRIKFLLPNMFILPRQKEDFTSNFNFFILVQNRFQILPKFAFDQISIWRYYFTKGGWKKEILGKFFGSSRSQLFPLGQDLLLITVSEISENLKQYLKIIDKKLSLSLLRRIQYSRVQHLWMWTKEKGWRRIAKLSPYASDIGAIDMDGDGILELFCFINHPQTIVQIWRYYERKWQIGQVTLPSDKFGHLYYLRSNSKYWLMFIDMKTLQYCSIVSIY